MKLETVIGLEIHVQLKTKSKMFCGCSNSGENQAPNTTICPICMGHPGTLPVPNKKAIEWSVKSALALNCQIPSHSKFDRKHYFYPDLPKAYQISQYDEPIGIKGFLSVFVKGEEKKIRIHRLHLEEDAAKLLHNNKGESFVDFNRAGTPLMEIVTEADIRSPEEAGAFLRELRLIMRYLGVSDADMEKGHLRCDANVSLRESGDDKLYPKTEIKNLNSFKAVEKALAYEILRQSKIWEETGKAPDVQGTRGWDEEQGKTTIQRIKEEANDYRYFPDPDIPELDFSKEWVDLIRKTIPELPRALRERFVKEYGFKPEDVVILSQDLKLAEFTECVVSELKEWLASIDSSATAEEIWERDKKKLSRLLGGWILSKFLGALKHKRLTIRENKATPENIAELISMVFLNKINSANAQVILSEIVETGGDPSQIMKEKDLGQISDSSETESIISRILSESQDQVAQYKSGKTNVLQYFVGKVMKETKGKANPEEATKLIKKKLEE